MNKFILNLETVHDLVQENRYKVDDKNKFISRCIDGRYPNTEGLPALAFPGADVGELALILATANSYGFDIDPKKVIATLIKVIGGAQNFQKHTDSHADPKVVAGGCGHWKQINLDPKAFSLGDKNLEFIKKNINIGKSVTLQGDHLEGAVLIIRGDWGVYPQFQLEEDPGKRLVEVFVYQQSLVDQRHKKLAQELIKNKAIKFYNGEDEEWLYNALSDVSEIHLMETAGRLAKGLPIYEVKFDDEGGFKINQQDVV